MPLNEGRIVREIRDRFHDPSLVVGIGDDAAAFNAPEGQALLACSDLLVEGTHFQTSSHPADALGFKSVAVNVSDIGAMGGIPMHFLLSLSLSAQVTESWKDDFFAGIERACREFRVTLIGGDLSQSAVIFIDVSMVGRAQKDRIVRRSGARPGQGIYVTGTLGGSAAGLERLLAGAPRDATITRHLYPEPRHRVGFEVAPHAGAMIDVSDGLSTDLSHVLEASGMSAEIESDSIPVFPGATLEHALHGGEDYELLIIADQLPDRIADVPLTRIGRILDAGSERLVLRTPGATRPLQPGGWQHFS